MGHLVFPTRVGVFPTRVGMDRLRILELGMLARVPHASGDGPQVPPDGIADPQCSPREWGWTAIPGSPATRSGVFPTRVGMDRLARRYPNGAHGVPHASGDGPTSAAVASITGTCSPREWGWTDDRQRLARRDWVFPTRVGMDRSMPISSLDPKCVPHASGDGPISPWPICRTGTCSPREWGWTDIVRALRSNAGVFPTRVGMDRLPVLHRPVVDRVPHASGDGPSAIQKKRGSPKCSPREWGWTELWMVAGQDLDVFPTRVGMDRRSRAGLSLTASVPHASGDGPYENG